MKAAISEREILNTLSQRESQVFLEIARGVSATQIAETLALSVKTVSTFRERVLIKLKLSSNAELAVFAFRLGLTKWPLRAAKARAT